MWKDGDRMPSMPTSVRIAGCILLALLAYFVFRGVTRSAPETPTDQPTSRAEQTTPVPEVIVRPISIQSHPIMVTLKGRTEPDRAVIVRSETAGIVASARIQEGQWVKRGEVLCGLSIESRAARVAEAEAAVVSAQLEYESARQLEEKGWTTSNRAASTKANLDRAEAARTAAQVELAKTKIRAPFSGIFESRSAEVGAFLSPGVACGEIVDLDPILVVVDATEQQMSALNLGAEVAVLMSNGAGVEGSIRFIARSANPQTRTFRVEIAIPNPEARISAGVTASVDLKLGEAPAVLLTPAALVLHDDGRVGVRYVDPEDIIRFSPVTIIDDSPDGIWVNGLPSEARLLATGQDYLSDGLKVAPIDEGL